MTITEGFTVESIILAVAPKVPALLSLGGSMYIVWSVLSSRQKRSKMYHRLMLGLSCSDILASHVYFLGTWLIPRGSSGPFGDVYMSFGTDGTCSYSGFFNQFGVASPLFNVSLSVYYLLHIQYGWRENALKKVEPIFHIIPIVFAMGTAITAMAKGMYGNVFWTCWINPDPPQPDFQYYQWSFLFAPVWVCILIQLSVMSTLWWTMRSQERLIARKYALKAPITPTTTKSDDTMNVVENTSQAGQQTNRSSTARKRINDEGKYSTRIAVQGSLYVLASCITWFFPTVQRITELSNGTNYFTIQVLDTTLLPLQGFFNVLIYIRPKYMTYRRKYPDLSIGTILKIIHDPKDERNKVIEFRGSTTSPRISQSRISISNRGYIRSAEGDALHSISEEMENGDLLESADVTGTRTEESKVNKEQSEETRRTIETSNAMSSLDTLGELNTKVADKDGDREPSATTIKRSDMRGRIIIEATTTSSVASSLDRKCESPSS